MVVRMWKRSLGVIHVPKPESGISAASGTARWTIRRPVLGAWAQTRARKAGCAASNASGILARITRRVRSVDMGDTLPSERLWAPPAGVGWPPPPWAAGRAGGGGPPTSPRRAAGFGTEPLPLAASAASAARDAR